MRNAIAIIGLCIVCGHVFGQTNQISTNSVAKNIQRHFTAPASDIASNSVSKKPDNRPMINGKFIKWAEIDKVQPDGLVISYQTVDGSIGVTTRYFSELPASIQRQYGYDPQRAADYEADKKEAPFVVAQQIIEQKKAEIEQQEQQAQIKEHFRQEMLKERAVEAQEQIAEVAQRQADAQEQAAQSMQEQNSQQQLNQIDQQFQQEEANQKLDDIDWDLWKLRNR